MKKLLKWVLGGLAGVLGLVVLAVAIIYVYMGHRLGTEFDVEGVAVDVPSDAESIAEGERLARLRGCVDGCHGTGTAGQVFFSIPDGSRVVAPDLGRMAADYSIADLERVIRHGVRPDRTSVLSIMPSKMFYGLTDEDLGAMLAFLQSREPAEEQLPPTKLGPAVRVMLLYFSQKLDFDILPGASIVHDAPRLDPRSADPLVRGEYLAKTICTECHADDLRGIPAEDIPSLAIVAAYSREDFGQLMKTGAPIGNRELDLMKTVSLNRFSHLHDAEVDSLHAFLQTLAVSD